MGYPKRKPINVFERKVTDIQESDKLYTHVNYYSSRDTQYLMRNGYYYDLDKELDDREQDAILDYQLLTLIDILSNHIHSNYVILYFSYYSSDLDKVTFCNQMGVTVNKINNIIKLVRNTIAGLYPDIDQSLTRKTRKGILKKHGKSTNTTDNK